MSRKWRILDREGRVRGFSAQPCLPAWLSEDLGWRIELPGERAVHEAWVREWRQLLSAFPSNPPIPAPDRRRCARCGYGFTTRDTSFAGWIQGGRTFHTWCRPQRGVSAMTPDGDVGFGATEIPPEEADPDDDGCDDPED